MATDFRYASQSDLEHYWNAYSDFDSKTQIYGWVVHSGSLYRADDCGLITQLFVDGQDLGDAEANSGVVNVNGEWYYDSALDAVYYYNSASTPADLIMEGGIDNATYFNTMLVKASLTLNSMLDSRYPTPIPKHPLYDANNTTVTATPEYDPLIIEATCYVCATTILRSKGMHDDAGIFASYVTNIDGTGIVDKLSSGAYKLAYEVDSGDSKGAVRAGSGNGGSMDIVETGGAYSGLPYDNILITCTTGGAYGVAIVKVAYYGSDKIQGSEKTNIKITGGLQHIHGGWYCRFQGASMTSGDTWEVGLSSETREIANAESGAIQLTRRGYGI